MNKIVITRILFSIILYNIDMYNKILFPSHKKRFLPGNSKNYETLKIC